MSGRYVLTKPNTIHRLWLGPRPMPNEFRHYGRMWGSLNPDWEVKDWSWHNLPFDLANQDVMEDLHRRCTRSDSIELATQMADIIDYELVWRYGGVYVNCDMQPVRPLLPEMSDGRAWASWEEPWCDNVVNAAFGGPPEHPFWKAVMDELPHRYSRLRAQGEQEMNQLTGPRLLGQVYQERREELCVYPSTTFNPVYWKDIPSGQTAEGFRIPDDSIAVHHWDHRRTGRSNVVS